MADLIDDTSVPLSPQVQAEMAVGGPPQPPGGPPSWKRLDFTVQHQEQTQWCWSAVAVSIVDFYDSSNLWTQCKLVCSMRSVSDCCQNGASEECNQPWFLDRALTGLRALARMAEVTAPGPGGASVPSAVIGEIEAQRPVGARIGWDGGGGHVVVIEGCTDDGATVAVEDPWSGSLNLPVGLLYRYQGTGTWTHVYNTKKP